MARTSRRRTSRSWKPRRKYSGFALVEVRPSESGLDTKRCTTFGDGTSKAAAVRAARERAKGYQVGEALIALTDESGKIYGVFGHSGRSMPRFVPKIRKHLKQTPQQLSDISQTEFPPSPGEDRGAAAPPEQEEQNVQVTENQSSS